MIRSFVCGYWVSGVAGFFDKSKCGASATQFYIAKRGLICRCEQHSFRDEIGSGVLVGLVEISREEAEVWDVHDQ